jgi:hypothetical protein
LAYCESEIGVRWFSERYKVFEDPPARKHIYRVIGIAGGFFKQVVIFRKFCSLVKNLMDSFYLFNKFQILGEVVVPVPDPARNLAVQVKPRPAQSA